MNAVGLIFERGVELCREADGCWYLQSVGNARVRFDATNMEGDYGLRLILVRWCNNGEPSDVARATLDLLSPQNDKSLSCRLDSLPETCICAGETVLLRFALIHTVGAVIHHCQQLAQAYARVCRQFSFLADVTPVGDHSECQYDRSPYYEFEALTIAVRCAYEATGRLIWQQFGRSDQCRPSNFEKMLLACKHKLPDDFVDDLTNSWATCGRHATSYRDCIAHYCPICEWPKISMTRIASGAWSCHVPIPENPECRSHKNFAFDQGIDALTHAWELTAEVIRVAEEVCSISPAK